MQTGHGNPIASQAAARITDETEALSQINS
jgi:hypothetical protein